MRTSPVSIRFPPRYFPEGMAEDLLRAMVSMMLWLNFISMRTSTDVLEKS